jgi:hypothetical protein
MLILQQLHRHIPCWMRLQDNRLGMPFAVIPLARKDFDPKPPCPVLPNAPYATVTLNRADHIDNVDTPDEMEQDVATMQALGLGTR